MNGKGSSVTVPASSMAYTPPYGNNWVGRGNSVSDRFGTYHCIGIHFAFLSFYSEGGTYLGIDYNSNSLQISNQLSNRSAYGYMHLQDADDNSMLDFNRNKDGAIYQETPNAPMAVHTYDIFSATAQGLYNNFRTDRSDVGIVYDPQTTMTDNNSYHGNEVGVGVIAHYLHENAQNNYSGTYGKWNTILNGTMGYYGPNITLTSSASTLNTYTYEPSYFKVMGELTATDH